MTPKFRRGLQTSAMSGGWLDGSLGSSTRIFGGSARANPVMHGLIAFRPDEQVRALLTKTAIVRLVATDGLQAKRLGFGVAERCIAAHHCLVLQGASSGSRELLSLLAIAARQAQEPSEIEKKAVSERAERSNALASPAEQARRLSSAAWPADLSTPEPAESPQLYILRGDDVGLRQALSEPIPPSRPVARRVGAPKPVTFDIKCFREPDKSTASHSSTNPARPASEAWLCTKWRLPIRDVSDAAALTVWVSLVAGSPNSVLFKSVRDDFGMSYGPRAFLRPVSPLEAELTIELNVPARRVHDAWRMVDAAVHCPIDPSALEVGAKACRVGLARSVQTRAQVLQALVRGVLTTGDPYWLWRVIGHLERPVAVPWANPQISLATASKGEVYSA
jgi:hypothetical protein